MLSDITLIRSYLKLTTGELKPLFDILRGSADPTSSWSLTSEGLLALQQVVKRAIEKQFVKNKERERKKKKNNLLI